MKIILLTLAGAVLFFLAAALTLAALGESIRCMEENEHG